MRTKLKVVGILAAATALVAVAGGAVAEGNGQPVKLAGNIMHSRATTTDTASGDQTPSLCSQNRWLNARQTTTAGDSPLDTNHRALFVTVCESNPPVSSEDADAYTGTSLHVDKTADHVQNLSYDYNADPQYLKGGAPRISVDFQSGDVAFLDGSTCNRQIGTSNWSRADFTGFIGIKGDGTTPVCSFHVTSGGGTIDTVYSSDKRRSAWQSFANQHPEEVVIDTFMEFDVEGSYRVDRISLGTDRLYNYADDYAVNCQQNEHVC